MRITFLVLVGTITMYGPGIDTHISKGDPLRCDTWATDWRYDESQTWIALSGELFDEGRVRCGQWVYVYDRMGARVWEGPVLDSGWLTEHEVVGDMPEHEAWFVGETWGIVSTVKLDRFVQ